MTEKKVYIIHENDDWTKHLITRLEELSIPYDTWFLDKGIVDIQDTPLPGVYYNRISASSHTRDHRYAPELTSQILPWLESHEAIVVNGSRAIELEVSKVKQYLALRKANIQTPKTIAAVGKEEIIQAARKLNTYPFIIKHNRAGKGLGVNLFDRIEELENYVNSDLFEDSIDGISLLQQYVKPVNNRVYRSEFIGGKLQYVVSIDSSDGFELCPADNCQIPLAGQVQSTPNKFQIVDEILNEKEVQKIENFLKTENVQVAAVEFIETEDGQKWAYDVNTNTNYNADAEEIAQKYGMLSLAKYLGELLEKV